MINEDVRPCKVLSFFQRFYHRFSFENSLTLLRNGTSTWLRRVKYYKYVKSDSCYNITWGNCNYRPSSVYFILFVLFFPFFCILFPFLRFGWDFRSHDYHVTGEHMVELGAIFCCCFSARANSSSTVSSTNWTLIKVFYSLNTASCTSTRTRTLYT